MVEAREGLVQLCDLFWGKLVNVAVEDDRFDDLLFCEVKAFDFLGICDGGFMTEVDDLFDPSLNISAF